jgi:hypothetical protein
MYTNGHLLKSNDFFIKPHIFHDRQNKNNNTPGNAIVNTASNISYRTMLEADDTDRYYRPMCF